MFSSSRAVASEAPVAPAEDRSSYSPDISVVKEEIEKLSSDEASLALLSRNDPIGILLRPAARALRGKSRQMLKSIVNIWVEQTKPLLGIAEMFRDMRDLEKRSQTMAAAAEEMTASINEVARSAELVADEAKNVKHDLSTSVEQVTSALVSMSEISGAFSLLSEKVQTLDNASEQIAAILKTIEKIAAQTNLLALNATIEAARAGEMGKGFAVVAGEVKTLAKQTAGATEDIRQRVAALKDGMNDILASMNEGAQKVQKGTAVIQSVNDGIHQVGGRVDEVTQKMVSVSATVQEQSVVVSEVTGNVAAIAQMSKDVIQKVEGVTDGLQKASDHVRDGLAEATKALDAEMLVMVAKADHASFKKRIIDTILGMGQEKSATLANHHSCRLGKWYESSASEAFKAMPAFSQLAGPHEKVHAIGKRVLELHEADDYGAALAEAQKLDQASSEVLALLDELHRAVSERRDD